MNKDNFRVYLRALEPEDYKTTYNWRQDEEYQNGIVSQKRYISLNTEKKWVESVINRHESGSEIRLAIALKENNEIIGLEYLTHIDHVNRKANEAYLIGNKNHRGFGYAYEARIIMLEYAFNQLNLNKIYAKVLDYNLASKKSLLKFGYKHEATLKEEVYKNGKYNDLEIYTIFKEQFIYKYLSNE